MIAQVIKNTRDNKFKKGEFVDGKIWKIEKDMSFMKNFLNKNYKINAGTVPDIAILIFFKPKNSNTSYNFYKYFKNIIYEN